MPAALLLLLNSLATAAPAQSPDRLIGLVEIPRLMAVADPNGPVPAPVRAPGAVVLRSAPSLTAGALVRIDSAGALETREHSYEESSAAVYAVQAGWYLVAWSANGRSGKGWLAPGDAGTFRGLGELLKEGLAYLTTDWDGRIFAQPVQGASVRQLPRPSDDTDIVVADHLRDAAGRDWLLVIILAAGRCDTGDQPPVVTAGWIPAHNASGKVQAWFYSRGC